MARSYKVTEPNFTIQASMDLIQIKNGASSNKIVRVKRWWWGSTDNSLPTAQNLEIRCRVLPVTVTDGSGGTTQTPQPDDPGDAASTFTALTRNTVKATTNGTARTYDDDGQHIWNGYDNQPENPVVVPPGSSFVFELVSASISGSPKISAGVEVEERGLITCKAPVDASSLP